MKQTVLFVDAEHENVNLLLPYFVYAGFDCHRVSEGRSALEWLSENHCDLLVLNVFQLDMDGVQLCRQLHETFSVAILVLSNQVSDGQCLSVLKAGAGDYLAKSINPKDILTRAKALLGNGGDDAPPVCQAEELFFGKNYNAV